MATRKELANRMIAGFAKLGNRQALGTLYAPNPKSEDKPGSVCALGALAYGYDNNVKSGGYFWPDEQANPNATCPLTIDNEHRDNDLYSKDMDERCSSYKSNLANVIMHLNDDHQWPITDIAGWLDDEKHRATTKATFANVPTAASPA